MSKISGENTSHEQRQKIMIFGTFDGVHKGHLSFFKQARALNPKAELLVSVARDRNVSRIKGQKPEFNEKARMALLQKVKLIDRVVLGALGNYLNHIKKENPDIIALGYDQKEYVENLKKDLKDTGLKTKIVRLRPFQAHIYKNHLLKQKRRGRKSA